MKSQKYLVAACLLVMLAGHAIAQPIAENNWWYHFVTSGANLLSGYNPSPNSENLGSNTAGYDMGRYGVHGLMWAHLTWVRSPEYAHPSTTDAQRWQYLENAKDKIEKMTSATVFKDISGCSAISYKGPTHEAITRYVDGYKGWGHKRSMDAIVALPSGMPRILKDQWYRMKIRCENSPAPSSFTTITIWLAPGGPPFPSTPHYMQTYRGLQKGTNQGDPIIEVRDALLEPVWYRKGTVAILSCFSNISVKNLSVYRGVGSGRTEFYSLQDHGAEYMADINDFYEHWIRVGHDSAHVTDRNVWSVEQEGSEYVIRTTAADGWPIAMPWSDAYRRDDNHGVYASAYLKYKDEVDFSSFNLENCEIEYDLRVGKRNTGYAESGMAFHESYGCSRYLRRWSCSGSGK